MHTMFDFITYVKGVEYVFSLTFIAGYIIYWEFLKPKPFSTVAAVGREDMEYVRKEGISKSILKIATAPFVGLAYIVALPFVFFYALFSAVVSGVTGTAKKEAEFGWRPSEAYLAGKKKEKKEEEKKDDKE